MSGAETGSVVVDGVGTFFRRIPGRARRRCSSTASRPTPSSGSRSWSGCEGPPSPSTCRASAAPSGRPPDRFDYTVPAYGDFVERALERLGVERVPAGRPRLGRGRPDRRPARARAGARLCVINAVPLLPGYRWHRTARGWRTPVLGELSTRGWTRGCWRWACASRAATGARRPGVRGHDLGPPRPRHLPRRSCGSTARRPESELARPGRRPRRDRGAGAGRLGQRDRYLPARFGPAFADALGDAELLELPDWATGPGWRTPLGRSHRGFIEAGMKRALLSLRAENHVSCYRAVTRIFERCARSYREDR